MALMGIGCEVHTHYDPKDKNDDYTSFPSLEASVIMHITEPFSEPRFHKHYVGSIIERGGFGDYLAEIEGAKDSLMISTENVVEMIKARRFDEIKNDTRWKYTYNQRLTAYPCIDIDA